MNTSINISIKNWNDIIGQEKVISNLKEKIEKKEFDKFFLFLGKKGTGKNSCIKLLSKELNYNFSQKENDFKVINFINLLKNSLDIKKTINEFYNTIKKKEYYILLFNELKIIPQRIIYILKYIVKFPNIIFFISEHKYKEIHYSIIENSYIFKFKDLSIKNIFFNLKKIIEKIHIKIDKESLFLISQYSNGSIGKSILILNQVYLKKSVINKKLILNQLEIIDDEFYFKIINFFLNKRIDEVFLIINKFFIKEEKNVYDFVIKMKKHFKNLFLSKNNKTVSNIFHNKKFIKNYLIQSKNLSYFILNQAIKICDIIEKKFFIKNIDIQLLLETFIIQLFYLFFKERQDDNLKNNNELKKEKIFFIKKIWNQFIQKINEKSDYHEFNELYKTEFQLYKNKILLIIPYQIRKDNLLLIRKNFLEFYKKIINDFLLDFDITIKNQKKEYKNENKIYENYEKIDFLNHRENLINSLIKRFYLKKISSIKYN